MTQIVAIGEPGGVMVAADRRLTFPDGSLHSDDATKMVLFEGRLLLAYTGLARIGHRDTGEWIASALTKYRTGSEALPGLTEKLNERWKSIRVPDRRLTIVGGGAAHFDGDPRTYLAMISNHGLVQDGTQDRFRWEVKEVPLDNGQIAVAGQPLPRAVETRLRRDLLGTFVRGATAVDRARLVIAAIQETSMVNRRVGADVMLGLSGKEPLLEGKLAVMSGGSPVDHHMSVFRPGDGSQDRWQTMWIVGNGSVIVGGGGTIRPGTKSMFEQ